MSRVLPLTWFLLVDFSRSLRVVVPPGLLLALYRVFFLYGSDAQYFGAVGAIMLAGSCEKPSTMENNQTMRVTPGSSVKTTSKRARSTWACTPGGVSKRTSKAGGNPGRISRNLSVTAV